MKTITAAVLAIVVLILLLQPAFFAAWDRKTVDALIEWVGKGSPSGQVTIVEIDDRSLAEFGRWPWPRNLLAELLTKIRVAGADTVAVDMMFPEADTGAPDRTVGLGKPPGRSGMAPTNDDRLADALKRGRFVIGFLLRFPPDNAGSSTCLGSGLPFALVETEKAGAQAFFSASGATCSLQGLSRSAAGTGFMNAAADRDGILRRVPLIAEVGSGIYPSLALSTYMHSRRIDGAQLTANSSGAFSLRVGNNAVPVDGKSELLLRFRGAAGAMARVSAAEILEGRLPPGALQGKVVVVGVSAMGLRDSVATPFGPSVPGYEVQATAIDNLIQNDPLRIPRESFAGEALLLLLMAIGSGWALSRLEPLWATPLVMALIASVWICSALLLATAHLVLSPFPATSVLAGNLALLMVWRVSTEKWRWEKQLAVTRKFVLNALTSLTSIHDVETGAHVLRVQRYAKALCDALAGDPRYRSALTPKTIELIYELIPIHDIGKVSVPDVILRKPGRLTAAEFEVIKSHITLPKQAFLDAIRSSGIKDEQILRLASDIILTHHERWDGAGYPDGLSGERIPLAGRIVSVVDVYDAMVSRRVYKEPMSHVEAIEYIEKSSGIQFDPAIVAAFVRVEQSIHEIKLACEDE